jgi:hypothetical protein
MTKKNSHKTDENTKLNVVFKELPNRFIYYQMNGIRKRNLRTYIGQTSAQEGLPVLDRCGYMFMYFGF